MNLPTDLIAHPDVVVPHLQAGTGEEAIRELHARLCAATPAVTHPEKLLETLLERARLTSVAIAADVALPHARTDAVERMVFAVGRAPEGIAFDAAHPRVQLIFLIGTPRDQVSEYLRVVAALSRLLRTEGVRAAMLAATTEDELREPLERTMKAGR
ncbi:MAG TPA: PTS sugar transporter subunit IIA [Opitutaceae bacterium]|nr:PTS sugar transporter subunit IIA [Opitutaceae bacterium]